ncbi:DUF6492 family protein [Polynucleobacter sp. CS-Odin-A6]|uniref:DUF6492 family protein n=1 Tax=Polynucleobacter sp. CS-Odin-A6 TaxID=2689106 RepID=UPI001C0C60B1|nr:DUF6492 family protein [Polynucleobacter sp. CS-Odin-A6]MBU3621195.1 hypothetical protein [Polynucleobacter sp. CS-Odin-A6]
MKDLILYCKSYRNDFLRLKRLLSSVNQYNLDQIPFYISTPRADHDLLISILGNEAYIWIADEEIVTANPRADLKKYKELPGGISQQIVKSEFWRLKISENYVCLDSDCIFIRNFFKNDFLTAEGIPYTVLHQNKEFFQMAANRGHLRVENDLREEARRVQSLFSRVGPSFYCAPAPFIWSARVWESLDLEHLKPLNISIWEFISSQHPETLIYGEALMKYRAIPLVAIEPLFRTYHYDWQYYLMKRQGETVEGLRQNYMGVIYQSSWDGDVDLFPRKKTLPSRMLRRLKRFINYLQSFI